MSLLTPLRTAIAAALVGAQLCLLSLRAEAAPELQPAPAPKARSLSLQYDTQSAAGSSTQALTLRFASGRQQLLATDGLEVFSRADQRPRRTPSLAESSVGRPTGRLPTDLVAWMEIAGHAGKLAALAKQRELEWCAEFTRRRIGR